MSKKKNKEYESYLAPRNMEDAIANIGDSLIKEDTNQEIVVHWVNKYGVPVDIKTRKGGLIHALWLAEHKKRSRKRLEQDNAIEIQPEITVCPEKQLPDADRSSL